MILFRRPCSAHRSALPLLLLAATACASPGSPLRPAAAGAGSTSGPWLQYADPAQAGFDAAALRSVCAAADSLRSGAFMAAFRGHVVVACGDVARPLEAHSVRKSLVSGLYGTAVARGEIDLDHTLADHGVDDQSRLTPLEKSAHVRQVIAARSGVYVPAAYAPASQDRERPARGSHEPGAHWFYNNWDFNVAGVIYERATGEALFQSFDRRVADPLGMEDWSPEDGFLAFEPTLSVHPAHTLRISTRDLARFGQLYLQRGRWADRQVVPEEWVAESTRPHTDFGDGTGYGYMWWTYAPGSLSAEAYPALRRYGFYMGRGTGGQGLWVIPGAELVVVHRGDTDHGREVDGRNAWSLVERVAAARRGTPVATPGLEPLRPTPLASQLPPVELARYRALPDDLIAEYLGEYQLAPGAVVRVFLFDGKPYMHVPGEGDALLLPQAEDTFTIRVVPGVQVVFERDTGGVVKSVALTLFGETMRARKI